PALQGFAKKNNISLDSLKTFSTDRGEYVGFETKIEGASAAEILAREIPPIVRSMSFPKTMIWMDPNQRFSRPLRWIIAKHGDRRIPIELFGVHSDSFSEGHRILGSDRVDVASFEDFIEKLELNFVIVSQEERRRKIQRELEAQAAELAGRI